MTVTGFEGKKVLIFGLKRSGAASALALHSLGAKVAVTDMKTKESGELAEELSRLPEGIGLFLGGHPQEALEGVDLVVVSPGVPMNIPALTLAARSGIEIISELELGFRLFKAADPLTDFYAITGTNGKSTTTALLHYILERSGRRALLAGNIGYALSGLFPGNLSHGASPEAAGREGGFPVVVEVSNFQLEGIRDFKPRISAILNLAPDHLDRYKDVSAYYEAKMKIFERQDDGDYLVLNAGDPNAQIISGKLQKAGPDTKAMPKVVWFGNGEDKTTKIFGLYSMRGSVYVNLPGMDIELIKAGDIRIKGAHNLENAMAAGAMALLAGVPAEAVRTALMEFPGLPHRMEFVRELDGVSYINDSKGTNPPAVLRSLESFSGQKKENSIILIAGGRDKNGDFQSLRNQVERSVKLLVLIGEASGKIAAALQGAAPMEYAMDLAEALRISKAAARPGDVVLLSPACASFDMFRDFEDRGDRFREEARRL